MGPHHDLKTMTKTDLLQWRRELKIECAQFVAAQKKIKGKIEKDKTKETKFVITKTSTNVEN